VGLSFHGDLLRFSDPSYVRTLRRGVNLMLWSVLVIVVTTFISGFGAAVMRGSRSGSGFGILPFFGYLLNVIGAWQLTEPDPSGLGEDSYGTARKLIRITLIIGLVNQVLSTAMLLAGPLAPALRLALQSIAFVAALVGVAGTFAELAYLRKLAVRIPDDSLAERARVLMWGLGVTYGVLAVVGFSMVLIAAGRGASALRGSVAALGCFGGIMGLAMIVFGVMYLFMLIRFRKQFAVQADLASAAWSAGNVPASTSATIPSPPLPPPMP
jgi:hypothetical protein